MRLTEEQCKKFIKSAGVKESVEYSSEDINRVFSSLSEQARLVVFRYTVMETSFDNIASELLLSATYVNKVYRDACRKLREASFCGWFREDVEVNNKTSIIVLQLSQRTQNALMHRFVTTIGSLIALNSEDLLKFKGLGFKGLQEIKDSLAKYNLSLADTPVEKTPVINVEPYFGTIVIPEMLNEIYTYCNKRTCSMGYERACKQCKYKGCKGADCMFNHQPRIWTTEES